MAMAAFEYNHTRLLLLLITLFTLSLISFSASDVHDLLRLYGLPAGIFPKTVKSHTLNDNNLLEVHLETPCIAKFENLIAFNNVVRGYLSYGRLHGLEGLSDKELFLWLPIRDIVVLHQNSGVISFDIALANKTMAKSQFDEPTTCDEARFPLGMIDVRVHGRKDVSSF